MKKNSDNFSIQEAMRLAESPAGQQLIALFRQSNDGDLQQAAKFAAEGDLQQAQKLLSGLLKDPQVQQLLKQLGR